MMAHLAGPPGGILGNHPPEIALLAQNTLFVRSWIGGGLLSELASSYRCLVLADRVLAEEIRKAMVDQIPGVTVAEFRPGTLQLYLSHWSNRLQWVVERKRSSSFEFWIERHFLGNQLWFSKKLNIEVRIWSVVRNVLRFLHRVFTQPLLTLAFVTPLALALLSVTKFLLVKSVRQHVVPNVRALLLTGVGTDNSNSIAVIAAKKSGVPSFQLMDNWDNLTSKAAYVFRSDFITVMGQKDVHHAVRIHGYQENEVYPIGLPKFEVWRQRSRSSPRKEGNESFRVMYAGFSLPHCEVRLVNYLSRALHSAQTLGQLHLPVDFYYRQHPARLESEFDDQLDTERVTELTGHFEQRVHSLPALGGSYISELLGYDLVICPPTTLLWECAMAGIPTLLDLTVDGIYRTSAGRSSERYVHIRELIDSSNPISGATFDELLVLVSRHIRGEELIAPLDYQDYISLDQDFSYVEKLSALIERVS